MNRLLRFVGAGVLVAAVAVANVWAQTSAVVNGDHLNVRSRPSLSGEVVTQLARGQVVAVLDEGVRPAGSTNAFGEWVRIALPPTVSVWIAAEFVDTTANTIKAKRLNVRAGPGEAYGVLGTLSEGTAVRKIGENKTWWEIETPAGLSAFVAGEYLQKAVAPPASPAPAPEPLAATPIPGPTNSVPSQAESTNASVQPAPPQPEPTASAPVAAETTAKRSTETPAVIPVATAAPAEGKAAQPVPTVAPPPNEKPGEAATASAVEQAATGSAPQPSGETTTSVAPPLPESATPKPITPAPAAATPNATDITVAPPPVALAPTEQSTNGSAEVVSAPLPTETKPTVAPESAPAPAAPTPAEAAPTPAATEASPPAESDQPPAKRIVRREGTVRATLSFQAPTPFELRAPDTGATMDYLLPASTNITIKPFWGARVIVSGQEAIDSRWPKTPVIKVETIELAP